MNRAFLLILAVALSVTGCVKRQMLIRTNPEGAFVTVDSQPLGNTPLQVPFTYSVSYTHLTLPTKA